MKKRSLWGKERNVCVRFGSCAIRASGSAFKHFTSSNKIPRATAEAEPTQSQTSDPHAWESHTPDRASSFQRDAKSSSGDGELCIQDFAGNLQLPLNYIDSFIKLADDDADTMVSFNDFITTIRAREMALNHACQPYETTTGQGVWIEAMGRGQWLLGLMVVQSLSGVVLQNFEKLIQVCPPHGLCSQRRVQGSIPD
jgi:hypothetical protein